MGIDCGGERPQQDTKGGLLGEVRTAEPSNAQRGDAERKQNHAKKKRIECSCALACSNADLVVRLRRDLR